MSISIPKASVVALTIFLGLGGLYIHKNSASLIPARTLKVQFDEKIETIAPTNLPDSVWGTVLNQVFEGLFRISRSGQLEAALVKDWSTNSNFTNFIFTLRTDVFFHDGAKLSASDVVYSLAYLKNHIPQMATGSVFRQISDIHARDSTTIEVTTLSSQPEFLYFLASPAVKIYKGGIFEAKRTSSLDLWVGTGAFKISKFGPARIILSKFLQYREPVNLDEIHFIHTEHPNNDFEQGRLDILEVTRKEVDHFSNDGRYTVNSYPMLGTFFLGFNLGDPAFSNPNLRRAILYAIDRSMIIDGVHITEDLIPAGVIPFGLLGYQHSQRARNLELAKALIAKIPKRNLPTAKDMVVLLPREPHPMALYAIQRIRSDLGEIGLPFGSEIMKESYGRGNWGDYFFHLKEHRGFKLYMRAVIASNPSTEYLVRDIFDSGSPMNLSGFSDDQYRSALKRQPENLLEGTLHQYYGKLNDVVMRDTPIIPLGNLYYNLVTRRESQFKLNAISPYFLFYKDVL